MHGHWSIRLTSLAIICATIPIGLWARSLRTGADASTVLGFLATYAGDTLWPLLLFFIGRLSLPTVSRLKLASAGLMFTVGLEFLQLCQAPILQWLRQQPGIGFLLGNSFVWSDVLCCIAGCCLALALDWNLTSRHSFSHDRQNSSLYFF